VVQLGHATGVFDLARLTRLGRAHAEGLRLIATAWGRGLPGAVRGAGAGSGAGQQTAMELAAQLSVELLPLVETPLLALYRRQQELV
jgi:hypothetical protein